MKTLRKTGFGSLSGFNGVDGGDGGLRRFVVARVASPPLSLAAVHPLSLSLLAAGLSPSLFSLFLFLFFFSLVFFSLSFFFPFSFLFFSFFPFSFFLSVASWIRAEVN